MQLDLPSGLKVETRKIRGGEAVELAERANNPQGNSLSSILRGCCLRVVEPGPYPHAQEGTVDWSRVLKGDLLRGLTLLRAGSIPSRRDVKADDPWPGRTYEFYVQCEASVCRKRYGWQINDIVNDLSVRSLPEESAARVRAGEPFTATATDEDGVEHALTFDLMLPEQDAILRQVMTALGRKRATSVESLATQTRTIDGKPVAPVFRQKFFERLGLGELNRLRDFYDAADCGIDTDILTTCPDLDCGHTMEVALPFGRTFWRPEMKAPPKLTDEPTA